MFGYVELSALFLGTTLSRLQPLELFVMIQKVSKRHKNARAVVVTFLLLGCVSNLAAMTPPGKPEVQDVTSISSKVSAQPTPKGPKNSARPGVGASDAKDIGSS